MSAIARSLLFVLLSTPALSGASFFVLAGTVEDEKTGLPVWLEVGDVTWSDGVSSGNLALNIAENGTYYDVMPGNLTYLVSVAIPGYESADNAPGVLLVKAVNEDFELIRSSRMLSITWAGDATELFDDQTLVGTLSLDSPFPKADTRISLAALIGNPARFELRDAAGDPLTGDLVVPAGELSVDFQLYAVPDTVVEAPMLLTLRATCDQIPLSAGSLDDQTLDAPQLTLLEAGRVVRLRYAGAAGTVSRYTDLAQALAGEPPDDTDATDGTGWAGFWSGDTSETAGFHFVPDGATKIAN